MTATAEEGAPVIDTLRLSFAAYAEVGPPASTFGEQSVQDVRVTTP